MTKTGRPKSENPADVQMRIRLTKQDSDMLIKCADKLKITKSDVVRKGIHLIAETILLEQEPKKGHWIDDKCSICGKGIEDLIDSREWYKNETPNYCPFCGERIVESEVTE